MTRIRVLVSLLLLSVLSPSAVLSKNLHEIESLEDGFAIYRSGKPDREDMEEYCRLGIQEMMVLSGNAECHEVKYKSGCPSLDVVYDEKQDEGTPVTKSFLSDFDDWVTGARRDNRKIAFRCNCGCHRTGRLAGYYQMKYRGLSYEEAKALMKKRGKWMIFYPGLKKQLKAMEDYIKGRPCSTKTKYCVRDA